MEYILLFIACLLGSILEGATGFGFSIFAISVLPFFIAFKTASPIVLLLALTISMQVSYRLRSHLNIKLVIPTILASIPGRNLGVYGLMVLNTDSLKILLGIALVLLAIYQAFFNKRIRVRNSIRNGIIAGFISGVLGGMLNIAGPPLVIYFFSITDDNLEYTECLQVNYLISSIYNVFLHILYGNINSKVLSLTGVGIISVSIGCYLGLLILRKLNKQTLNRFIYSFMTIMGLVLIIKSA